MKRNSSLLGARFRGMAIRASIFALAVLMAGCAATPHAVPPAAPLVTVSEDAGPLPTLAYYQMLQRMTSAQVNRERMVLAALPPTPNTQVRTAMVLGHPRGQQDFTKALALLEGVLKSTDPGSVSLHPLARLLADNYSERQKLETQLEKQGQQLKDSQRKTVELQEKIDELADIERTLPQRPRATRPVGGTR
jgi:hypothetical protein